MARVGLLGEPLGLGPAYRGVAGWDHSSCPHPRTKGPAGAPPSPMRLLHTSDGRVEGGPQVCSAQPAGPAHQGRGLRPCPCALGAAVRAEAGRPPGAERGRATLCDPQLQVRVEAHVS